MSVKCQLCAMENPDDTLYCVGCGDELPKFEEESRKDDQQEENIRTNSVQPDKNVRFLKLIDKFIFKRAIEVLHFCEFPTWKKFSSNQQISIVPTLEENIIGVNAQEFWITFQRFKSGNIEGFVPTWNWLAFILGGVWFFYRKIYWLLGIAIPLYLLAPTPYIGLNVLMTVHVFSGVTANYLYYRHVIYLSNKIRENVSDESQKINQAKERGGVDKRAIWGFIGLFAYLFTVIIVPKLMAVLPPNILWKQLQR